MARSKEDILSDMVYFVIGAKSEWAMGNKGDEEEWLNRVYQYAEEYQRNEYDIKHRQEAKADK